MTFVEFCRGHGILIDTLPPPGRWMRYATTDHPRKKNGAVKWMGEVGFCQNHATQVDVAQWRPDADAPQIDTHRIAEQAAQFERRMRAGWQRAAEKAAQMVGAAKQAEHPYLHMKGFGSTPGLVLDEALIVPMRHWQTNALVGAQVIRWLPEERRYEKKMIPGMRAKGAVFRIGSPKALRTWLVEGFATGLSVEAAVRLMNGRDAVLVCFSAGNLIHVAGNVGGERFVFADNDESGTGERAAQATGLSYCISGTVGQDANDMHKTEGVFRVANLMMDAALSVAEPDP